MQLLENPSGFAFRVYSDLSLTHLGPQSTCNASVQRDRHDRAPVTPFPSLPLFFPHCNPSGLSRHHSKEKVWTRLVVATETKDLLSGLLLSPSQHHSWQLTDRLFNLWWHCTILITTSRLNSILHICCILHTELCYLYSMPITI